MPHRHECPRAGKAGTHYDATPLVRLAFNVPAPQPLVLP